MRSTPSCNATRAAASAQDRSVARAHRAAARRARRSPQTQLPPVIHVAGTNGKGSTIAFLRAMLEAAGKRVHVYTSPHLVRFNERIRLAGELVDDERLADALERCERVNAGAPITFFEITTAAAFAPLRESAGRLAAARVGLGGRYDATNVIDRPAATRHHLDLARPSRIPRRSRVEKIAYEKAGILKKRRAGDRRPVGRACPRAHGARGATGRRAATSPVATSTSDPRTAASSTRTSAAARSAAAAARRTPPARKRRRRDRRPAAVAPEIPAARVERGMRESNGRRGCSGSRGPHRRLAPPRAEVWLDGGHNEDGGRVLAEAMAEFHDKAPRPLALICGAQTTKDTARCLRHFDGLAREASPCRSRASTPKTARGSRGDRQSVGLPPPQRQRRRGARIPVRARLAAPPRVLIAGSLYLAASVLEANDDVPR